MPALPVIGSIGVKALFSFLKVEMACVAFISIMQEGSMREVDFCRHNRLGDPYSVKLVYPGFYSEVDLKTREFTVGFPKSKRRLAQEIQPGHLLFVYVTSPEKWVIGLGRVTGWARESLESEIKRPYLIDLEWIVGPKSSGVKFVDVGLMVKPRIGDSLYAIDLFEALSILERLRELPDLREQDLARRIAAYSKSGT